MNPSSFAILFITRMSSTKAFTKACFCFYSHSYLSFDWLNGNNDVDIQESVNAGDRTGRTTELFLL